MFITPDGGTHDGRPTTGRTARQTRMLGRGTWRSFVSAVLAGLILVSGQSVAVAEVLPTADESPAAEVTPAPEPTAEPAPETAPEPVAEPAPAPAEATAAYIVSFSPDATEAEQRALLAEVAAAELSPVPELGMYFADLTPSAVAALRDNALVARVEADKTRAVEAAPSDPSYGEQWSLPQIGWDRAREAVQPAGRAVVAVLDTGVDGSHPDLDGNLVPGTSVLDGGDGLSDPNGHGTAMAGIVAAETDNAAGISGVGYAGVKVMPVTVLGDDGTGQDSDVISGLVYAADHGADVVLMSFSSPSYSPSLQAAVDYAWSKGTVLVAATGNDGSSTATFPAGARGVVGVSATGRDDALIASSNFGDSAFIAAPGADIASTATGGGVTSMTGTSTAAAAVAGAAAVIRANDPTASNGVVVSRLARTADQAGTPSQTGNGRVNLERALADESTDTVVPQGVAGDGGPFVGPYLAAAFKVDLQGQSKTPCTGGGACDSGWQSGNVSGWQELDVIPMRLKLTGGPGTQQVVLNFDHSNNNGQLGIENLFGWNAGTGATMTTPVLSAPVNGSVWSYSFEVRATGGNNAFVTFNTRLAAGAHYFSGSSLALGGSTVGGNLQIAKPGAVPGSPDLAVVKSGPTSAGRGELVNYTLSYSNRAGAASTAVGVQLVDTLPAGVTVVDTSPNASVVGNTVSWDLGNLAPGATGQRTIQVRLPADAPFGTAYTDRASIQSAQNDANLGDNASALTTTVSFNRAPVAVDDSKSTNEDQSVTFAAGDLTVNDTDADNDSLSVTGVSNPVNGSVSMASGSVTFTPAADFNGAGSFKYTVSDGRGGSATGTVNVQVLPVNDVPSAESKSFDVERNSSGNTVTLSGYDLETAAAGLSYSVTQQPVNGTLSGSGFNLTYTPAAGYVGPDTFKYTVTDTGDPAGCTAAAPACAASRSSATAIVTINVTAPATQTVPANAAVTYGDANASLTAAVSSVATVNSGSVTFTVRNGATVIGSATSAPVNNGTASVTYPLPAGTPAGSYTVHASYAGTRLADSSGTSTLTLNAKALTVTADDRSKTYGDTLALGDQAFSTGQDQLVNGDTVTSVTLSSDGAGADAGVRTGGYPIVASAAQGSGLSNYDIRYVDGTLTVNKAALSLVAENKSKTYGEDNPPLTFSANGLVNGDTKASALTADPQLSTTAVKASTAGDYVITISGGASNNYRLAHTNGTLTVGKAVLTVTANDATRQYSDPNPQFSVTYDGWVLGDGPNDLGGSLSYGVPAASATGTGTYAITPSGLSSTNYTFNYKAGTLTVTHENVAIEYTGDELKSTGSTSSSSTTALQMAASLVEESDGHLGDTLVNKTVRFDLYGVNADQNVPSARYCTVGAVRTGLGTATAQCSISAVPANDYIVKVSLVSNNQYKGIGSGTTTVVLGGTGFTTGGGWLAESNIGSRANFGFTVKYLKNGNIQGNSVYIYRKTFVQDSVVNGVSLPAGSYNWIVKSNAMGTLTQQVTTTSPKIGTAAFTGKSNITAVNRVTGVAYSLGGNYNFKVDVTDRSEPGSTSGAGPDSYAIRVWDASGTYYQVGTPTSQIPINGGNIQVRP